MDSVIDQIHLGDCLPYLKSLPDQSVDLVVSSPPYNIGKEYETRRALQVYLQDQQLVLAECVRTMKDGGSLFWQVGSYSDRGTLIPLDVRFFPMLEDLGLLPRNRIVWARTHGLHAKRKFSARHETILWFTKGDDYHFDLDTIRVPQKYQEKKAWRGDRKGQLTGHPDGKNPGDIWVFRNVKHNHEEQTVHPAQFPEDMIARIMLATTRPGATVLDPYMGVGTVAVVARDNERHFLGAELDPDYRAVAMRRLAGRPDESGTFPNLKTLRDYAEATGTPASNYQFDVQTGAFASGRDKSKIFSEEHHLAELEDRLAFEESSFAAKLKGSEPPIDRRKQNLIRIGLREAQSRQPALLGDED